MLVHRAGAPLPWRMPRGTRMGVRTPWGGGAAPRWRTGAARTARRWRRGCDCECVAGAPAHFNADSGGCMARCRASRRGSLDTFADTLECRPLFLDTGEHFALWMGKLTT